MNIVIISGACCDPSLTSIDTQARKIIDDAILITGVKANVLLISASDALENENYRNAIEKGMKENRSSPGILIDGEVISYGIPKIEEIKNILLKYSDKG